MYKSMLALAVLASWLVAGTATAAECRYSKPINVELDGAGLRTAQFKLGSSDMRIEGAAGLAKLEVHATACASSEDQLKNLDVSAVRQGDAATIDAQNDGHGIHFGLFGSSYAYVKLDVRVPAGVAVAVKTGSGDVDASGLASLEFHSGSGDLQARDISGALTLKLGSADVLAQQVGSVALRGTGSGDVKVDGVHGDVRADRSGSGDLHFSNVQGGVTVGSTGSGDITLDNIGGDIEVGSTGSGDVTVNGAGGNLHVGATGSGDVHYHGVKGKVSVPRDRD